MSVKEDKEGYWTVQNEHNERAVFKLLWDMVNAVRGEDSAKTGMIISRYAGMLDDRIENSGYSRSVDSLKLYSYEQLQDELDERDSEL